MADGSALVLPAVDRPPARRATDPAGGVRSLRPLLGGERRRPRGRTYWSVLDVRGVGTCEACPTWLSESLTHRHMLDDGGEVLIRPLVYGDRFELAAGFTELSLRSRQLRFFQPPETLGRDELEYLTNIDYQNHFAFAAMLLGGPAPKGIGVGRYLRDPTDPATAEVAVTVMDEHQRRGVGTLLTRALGEVAAERGIDTFVSYVQWGNDLAIESLAREGARVLPDEPGIARIEIDVPVPVADPDSFVRRILGTLGALNEALFR